MLVSRVAVKGPILSSPRATRAAPWRVSPAIRGTALLFNKPFGVRYQFRDVPGQRPLADYIPIPGVYPTGRLDEDSEGLLLLANDGPVQHHLVHKRRKTDWVPVKGVPEPTRIAAPANPGPPIAEPAHPRAQDSPHYRDLDRDPRGRQPTGPPHDRRRRTPDTAAGACGHRRAQTRGSETGPTQAGRSCGIRRPLATIAVLASRP